MNYDFDQVIDRTGTNSLKYDFKKERGVPEDVLPLWVADMDFQTAPAITERLSRVIAHGIYGYTEPKDDYFQALAQWYETGFDWRPRRPWLIKTPGVVFALAQCVRAYTKPGESVLIQQPVYYPFSEVVLDNDRKLVNSPLVLREDHYEIDFADFEEKIVSEEVKLFLLCSPHNPVGRVWTRQELSRMEEICLSHGVIVVSDEIHSDFVWPGHRHHVLASLEERYQENTVICTAPSKSFNLAGLQCSNIFIPNQKLRRRFRRMLNQAGYSQMNQMGLAACQAAYEEGGEWLAQLKEYIYGNICWMEKYIQENIPQIRMLRPEGTYLVWLDFRGLGLTEEQREELILKKAKLWFDSGAMFGPDGEGFERVNAACPRATLVRAMEQLRAALEG